VFEEIVRRIIDTEGGLTYDPQDRGNWTTGVVGKGILKGTKYGISAAAYPQLDIAALTVEDAVDIYYKDYWLLVEGPLLPVEIAELVFDSAVNSGVFQTKKWLQAALGVTVDGVIGPKTKAAIAKADPGRLASRFVGFRLEGLLRSETWTRYSRSWTRRIAKALQNVKEP